MVYTSCVPKWGSVASPCSHWVLGDWYVGDCPSVWCLFVCWANGPSINLTTVVFLDCQFNYNTSGPQCSDRLIKHGVKYLLWWLSGIICSRLPRESAEVNECSPRQTTPFKLVFKLFLKEFWKMKRCLRLLQRVELRIQQIWESSSSFKAWLSSSEQV